MRVKLFNLDHEMMLWIDQVTHEPPGPSNGFQSKYEKTWLYSNATNCRLPVNGLVGMG